MTNDTRAAFEAAMESRGYAREDGNFRLHEGMYTREVEFAWGLWLASRRSALKEATRICEETWWVTQGDDEMAGSCIKAADKIRALGDEGTKL